MQMSGGDAQQYECAQYHRMVHLKMAKMVNFVIFPQLKRVTVFISFTLFSFCHKPFI